VRPTNVTSILSTEKTVPPVEGVPISDHPGVSELDAALERLHDEHYVRLVRLSVLLLGDVGRAEEVVQDSFVAIYQRMRRDGPDVFSNAPAYLRQTVVNRSRSTLRHLKLASRQPSEVPADEPGADHDVWHGVRRRAVLDALAELPRRQREVLALRYYLDLSERDIAQTLGISPGAVKSHASRGAAALRRHLSDLVEETP
jgi:RNA polymerase sigma-70 factor (sigma-E family)